MEVEVEGDIIKGKFWCSVKINTKVEIDVEVEVDAGIDVKWRVAAAVDNETGMDVHSGFELCRITSRIRLGFNE